MPRLTKDEVSTAAQLAGVPPALALAIWQKERKGGVGEFKVTPKMFKQYATGSINDPVDNMHAGLAIIAEGLRQSGGDWKEAIKFYYDNNVPAGFVQPVYKVPTTQDPAINPMAKPYNMDEFGVGTYDYDADPEETARMQSGEMEDDDEEPEIDMPGFTRAMHRTQPYDTFNQELNNQGMRDYELDRYIRRLVDEEFDNGRPVRT